MKRLLWVALVGACTVWGQVVTTPTMLPPEKPVYDHLKTYLGINDAQVQQLVQIQKSRQDAEAVIWKQISDRQTTLSEMLKSGSTDAVRIGQMTIEINNLQKQIPLPSTQYRSSALNVLTPDQRTKLPALEQALRVAPAGFEAWQLSLIDTPPGDVRTLPAIVVDTYPTRPLPPQ